ncbi:ABC transporter substrate-binding protein [Roseomonas elaeocarpi]|uniref:ABC transporter substrate-binding protein n=1 Tax=Roseomonas elaeocarpi TaxID=907779 RepID=A0ABV6JS23_9PROT
MFQAAAATLLAAPAVAQNTRGKTLRFVPQSNLSALDPIWTTATVVSNHGYYVFDTLYALDAKGEARPQMAEGHEVSADGRQWRIRLRDGLKFHDNEPVRAVDCIASLQRWGSRDPFGQLMLRAAAEWRAADDRTIEIRMNKPFPLLLQALAKADASVPFIMPERLAKTEGTKAITEMVGSGPYRFVNSEFNSGSRAVYEKFAGYVPRSEKPERASGGKVANFDRIEWNIIPDPATASAALMSGEVDWWERPLPDLMSMLASAPDLRLEIVDPIGKTALMRMNALQAPFNDVKLRRAVLMSVRQEDYMRASQGDDRSTWSECRSLWPRNTPYFAEQADLMPGDLDKARAALKEAGYKDARVVVINPTDYPDIGQLGQVTGDTLRRIGMNVDMAESDWGTVVQRRASKEAVDKGGWSIFHTTGSAQIYSNPALSPLVRGQGSDGGWFGWWKNDRAEELTEAWLNAADPAQQAKLAGELGRLALEEVATVPLGQFTQKAALRKDIVDLVQGTSPYPWGVRRA